MFYTFQSEKCNSSSNVAETFTLKMKNLISKVNLRLPGFRLKYFVGPKKYLLGSRGQRVDVQFEHIWSQPGRSFWFYIFVSPQTTFYFFFSWEIESEGNADIFASTFQLGHFLHWTKEPELLASFPKSISFQCIWNYMVKFCPRAAISPVLN